MKHEQPCYFCIVTSAVLSLAMIVATVKASAWVIGGARKMLDFRT